MPRKTLITNARGEKEFFSPKKILRSAKRVGATDQEARKIANIIETEAYSGMKTSDISLLVKEILEKKDKKAFMRFNLKEAMRKLGPTGYSFEKFVGEIFKSMDYKVKLNLLLSGECVNYEIDLLAEKNDFIYIGECKYHQLPDGKVDLQVALANYARFDDIMSVGKFRDKEIKSILVTNTKLTTEAIRYSEGKGIDLLGWRYPSEQGLEYLIESRGLYPLTILPSFSGKLAELLINRKAMLVKTILKMRDEGFPDEKEFYAEGFDKLVKEAEVLLEK